MDKLFISSYMKKLCYINTDNKLVLSKMNGTETILISQDIDFVNSISLINLQNNYLVVKTIDNNIYYCDISCETENGYNMEYLGTYQIISMCWLASIFFHYLYLASPTQIILFLNFEHAPNTKYIVTNDEHITTFSRIGGAYSDQKFLVSVDTGVTYILSDTLNILTTLKYEYVSIMIYNNYYYCTKTGGSIDIYNDSWIRTCELELKIKSINSHYRLSFISRDNKYYYYLRDKSVMPTNNNICSYNAIENCIIFFTSCPHINNCECRNKYTYVIFEAGLTVFDEKRSVTYTHNFDFKNFVKVTRFGDNAILLVDCDGTISLLEYNIDITNSCINSSIKYIHSDKIKIRAAINTKKALA
jgi:hypothetical protein